MTSFSQNFQKMRKVSSQILDKVICVKFHQNRPNGAKMKGCDRHTDRQTHRQASSPGLIRNNFEFNHESFEIAQMSFTSRKEVLHCMCIYRSGPTRANKYKLTDGMFFDQFPELLDYCNFLHGKICFIGDFNFHVENKMTVVHPV